MSFFDSYHKELHTPRFPPFFHQCQLFWDSDKQSLCWQGILLQMLPSHMMEGTQFPFLHLKAATVITSTINDHHIDYYFYYSSVTI